MRELMQALINAANELVSENTRTTLPMVSPDMVRRAQNAIDAMEQAMLAEDGNAFNRALIRLYSAIPRPLGGKNLLEFEKAGQEKRLKWEQEFLDAIDGAIKGLAVKKANPENDRIAAIMMENGLSGAPASEEELKEIRKLMGSDRDKLVRAWRVENSHTRLRYGNYLKQKNITETKTLWHGSATGNFLSILTGGLTISKAAGYGMFGKGIYFASDFDKSRGYCSARNCRWRGGNDSTAMLAIFEVATGKPLHLDVSRSDLHDGHPALKGKDSVWAHKGANLCRDELIVYNDRACTIKYIVETR